MAQAQIKVRFDSKAQKEKFARAAKLRRWSLNTFLLMAAETYCDTEEGKTFFPTKDNAEKGGVTA